MSRPVIVHFVVSCGFCNEAIPLVGAFSPLSLTVARRSAAKWVSV